MDVSDIAKLLGLAAGGVGLAGAVSWAKASLRSAKTSESSAADADALTAALAESYERVAQFEHILSRANDEKRDLWRFWPAAPPRGLSKPEGEGAPRIVSFVNLKGGVGKSTLAANLAAHFALARGMKVLLMDLDYQGSVSNTVLPAVRRDAPTTNIREWFADDRDPVRILGELEDIGGALPGSALAASSYDLAPFEQRLWLRWILGETEDDVRFRLAQTLWSDHALRRFDLVFLDVPPRMTLTAVNALCASTHFIVPTLLDRTSTQPIEFMLRQFQTLFWGLGGGPRCAGVVANLTKLEPYLLDGEESRRLEIVETLRQYESRAKIFERHVPHREDIAESAGLGFAYHRSERARAIFDRLGDEIAEALFGAEGARVASDAPHDADNAATRH